MRHVVTFFFLVELASGHSVTAAVSGLPSCLHTYRQIENKVCMGHHEAPTRFLQASESGSDEHWQRQNVVRPAPVVAPCWDWATRVATLMAERRLSDDMSQSDRVASGRNTPTATIGLMVICSKVKDLLSGIWLCYVGKTRFPSFSIISRTNTKIATENLWPYVVIWLLSWLAGTG